MPRNNTNSSNLAERVRRLADNVTEAPLYEQDRVAELFDEFLDRMVDTAAVGDRRAVRDPRFS